MTMAMGPKREASPPTRETAFGLEEFRGGTVGTVWAKTMAAAKEPTPTRLMKDTGSMLARAERWSRLRTAAFDGKLAEVARLSDGCTKAELDAPDKAGWTALMYAARGGHLDIVRLLLERGANVNASNSKGWTALMFASWLPTPNEQLVRCLMQAGADASARNNAGLSCADEARSQQNEAIADLLDAQSGANPQTPSHVVAATPPRPSPARSSRRPSGRGKVRAAPGRPTTMGVDQRLRCLENVQFLKPLTGGERRRLARVVEVRSYAAGEIIVRQGDEGTSMFILMFGSAEATVEGVGIVQGYGSGDSFGELALLTSERRGATIVTTSTEAVCACLHRKQFELLVGKLGKCMSELRRRLRANAYFDGRQDYERLFHHYDRDNSGVLDWDQFRSAVRRDGQVTTRAVSERQLRILFDLIDLDGNGCLGQKEFVLFISSSMKGATAWEPKRRLGEPKSTHGSEHDAAAHLVHIRPKSDDLSELQQQEQLRRKLAQQELEQKKLLRKKEREISQNIAHAANEEAAEPTPRVRRQPAGSVWREVPASEPVISLSSPPEDGLGETASSSSPASPAVVVQSTPTAQTPPGQPPAISPEYNTDVSVSSSVEGSAKQGRASDEALWTPRTARERRVTVNLRQKTSQLEKENARLKKELQDAQSACAIVKEEGAAMVLRLRQATKDVERERIRADDESRSRAICEGERDAATKMARAATDRLADLERDQQRHQSSVRDQPDGCSAKDSAEDQSGETTRTHSPRHPQEEHHSQDESSDSAALGAASPTADEGQQVAASLRRNLSPQPEKGDLSSPVQSLEELEQQAAISVHRQTSVADTSSALIPKLAPADNGEPGLIEVVCPQGVASGDLLTVEIGDECGTIEVEVPPGIRAGDAFLVDERQQVGSLEMSVDKSTVAAAAAALEAAEQRADESERKLDEVMGQHAAALQRHKEDDAKLERLELALAKEKQDRVADQAGLSAYLDRTAGLKQSLAEKDQLLTQSEQEIERIRTQLASTEAELLKERLAHGDARANTERLMEQARNTAADVAKASETASEALLAELRMEQNARSSAENEVERLRAELTTAQQATDEVAVLQERVEQEQKSTLEAQKALQLAERKVLEVVEETASAVMSARAEEAALAVVNARRDMAAENEESVATAVAAERSRLEAIHEAASQHAAQEISELLAKTEAQALQEKEAVAMWEEQEAALTRQLEEAENDLAEVTQAYPLALEEAKASLAAAHEQELQALRDEPQPEPENTEQVNDLLDEIEELKAAAAAQTVQEKSANELWKKQEALLGKQLEEEKRARKAADEASAALESRNEAAAHEISELRTQAEAQALQEKEAVAMWEEQEAALMRQLEEAENDLAELTQAYPLALEEAKASLAEAHAHEMEVATGVSALVSAEPAPVAEPADESRINELKAELQEKQEEIEDLYEIHEQRSQQISTLEQDVLYIGRQLSDADALKTQLRTELNDAQADNEALRLQLQSLEMQNDTERLKAELLKQEAEMKSAEEAHQRSLQNAESTHAAELEALKQVHNNEVAAARNAAVKESETVQTALRNVRTMLTPVKTTPADYAPSMSPANNASTAQISKTTDDRTAALEAREAAALRQVEELRVRLEEMEKMQLHTSAGADSNTGTGASVARSRSSEMARTVRTMLSGVDISTPVRTTQDVGVATSAEQLQDEYLKRAILAAEIARANTPNTAKRKQELLGSDGTSSTSVDLTGEQDRNQHANARRQQEEVIKSTLEAGIISPAEAEKMLLHHQLEASLTPAKDDTVLSPFLPHRSSSGERTSWDQLAHKLDGALTNVSQTVSDAEHDGSGDDDEDDGGDDDGIDVNPFEVASDMDLQSLAAGLAADSDSDPFKTSSDEDDRPLSPVLENEEPLQVLSADAADTCEEAMAAVDGQNPFHTLSQDGLDILSPVPEEDAGETGSQSDLSQQSTASLLEERSQRSADAIASFVPETSTVANQQNVDDQKHMSTQHQLLPRSDSNTSRLVNSMQACLDEHSPIPASAYGTESLVDRMRAASTVPLSTTSTKVSMSSLLDDTSESLSGSESESTDDDHVEVVVAPDV